jgi:glycosyltransferase involved in cell wall biosynthesis
VRDLLREGGFDLVHVEGFYLMQHVPTQPGVPVLLVEQNVEYELARQRAVMSGSADAMLDAAATERAERRCWESATRLAAVTEEDANVIAAAAPSRLVQVVPDGADHLPSLRVVEDEPVLAHPGVPLMVLLGNFAYEPNVDAAGFMCSEILPRIRAQVPQAELWLVGHAPTAEVKQLADARIRVTGVVPDVRPYLDIADVVVCPLRIGGGIKVKTIEALRRGKAIVSTSVGAQGLDAACRGSLVIADQPDGFASEVASLLRSPQDRAQLGRRAAAAARDLPTWDQAAAELARTYEELLHTAPVRARLAGGWK